MGEVTFLERLLAPRAVLLGAAIGFGGCVAAGHLGARSNVYPGFDRFNIYISPQNQHYPTASQLRELGRARADGGQILVVVGGSSVFHGAGQSAEELWTRRLQEELGDGFAVLNLAMPAGAPHEFGAYAAEMLARDHEKVIYVAPVSSSGCGEDPDGYLYRYLYWDAYTKGMLPPNPAREERLAKLNQARRNDPKTGPEYKEFMRRIHCDRYLRFQDCWTRVTVEHGGIVWTPFLDRSFWKPRASFADTAAPAPPLATRYLPQHHDVAMTVVRNVSTQTPHVAVQTATLQSHFPSPARERTVLVVVPYSPHYVEQLTSAEREAYHAFFPVMLKSLEGGGFPAVHALDRPTASDFADFCHLSGEGGAKMARHIAPKIRDTADKLGYTKREGAP